MTTKAQFASTTLAVPEVTCIPKHVAIIMDGNGRWATSRRLPRIAGHRRGLQAVRKVVETCARQGVDFLTLFAFSSENWRRPPDEVSFLMRLFVRSLKREVKKLHDNNLRLKVVGDLSVFSEQLKELIDQAHALTEHNTGMTLTVAANYGGRWDILQATQKMLLTHQHLCHDVSLIDESSLSDFLAMAYAPEPDLFIRTGGECRISNFLIWQLAYTELYFTDVFWPDFDELSLEQAFLSYQTRERRFGRTSAQLFTETQ